jgi:phosphoserine phosphatase
MDARRTFVLLSTVVLAAVGCGVARSSPASKTDPLPSWREGPAKQAIMAFVAGVTRPGAPTFVPPAERIAVFDNDGTLWAEQPIYFQFLFALDRVKALAPQHPEWRTTQPFKAALEGDLATLAAGGVPALLEVVMATHAGTTTEEFGRIAADWLESARHPTLERPYTDLVYQPMLELLRYLRGHEFKTFVVSGGGVEFLRAFAERVYGIPPEQVVGSTITTEFARRGDRPVLIRQPKVGFIDDKAGKPVAVNSFIGRRPLLAFGNSDGDHEMLQWTAAGPGPRFLGLVHHTDAGREWAYDRQSHVGRLDRALDEARARGWTVVDMKRDWLRVFPFEP